MFNTAALTRAVVDFFKSIGKAVFPDHEYMAAEVRALGPDLFDRLTTQKEAGYLEPTNSQSVFYDVHQRIDRKEVLESQDLYRASESSDYSPRERAVLGYLATYINAVGERVGTMTVLAPRGGASFAYSVIRRSHLETFHGPGKRR
jgi:hypothetical protein